MLWLCAGLVLLGVGAEMLVRGATRLAASLGIPPLVLGLTVVAIGTSMPELAVGLTAAGQGSGGLAVGNIAGTNVFNILVILGLSALLSPLPMHLRVVRFDLPVMLAASVAMAVLAWDGVLARADGLMLLAGALAYTAVLFRVAAEESRAVRAQFRELYGGDGEHGSAALRTRIVSGALLVAGIGLTLVGADWLVDGAIAVAHEFGIAESVIGLTIVAAGTSAPELATTIAGTLKGDRGVAVGTVIGSSIYNILAILGLTCIGAPRALEVERHLLLFDIPLLAGIALLCIPVFVSGRGVSRAEGALFIAIYLGYMVSLAR
jgi:cation:H+ antiporter